MRLVLLSSFVGPVCMGEGHPRLLVVGPLAVVPPPLGPFVTGASMLLMIWSRAKREGDVRRGTIGRKGREKEGERQHSLAKASLPYLAIWYT